MAGANTVPTPAESAAPEVGTPEYDAAMIAKADGGQASTTPPAPADRPEWLPEKFSTPEDMARAYAELEKRMGSEGGQKAAQEGRTPETETPSGDPADAAKAAVESAGLDMASLEQKVVSKGALDDGDYAALEAKGISRDMVDRYIAGQQAMAEAITNRVADSVGGWDAMQGALQWAAEGGITPEEAAAFNRQVEGADEAGLKLAMAGLMARYNAAEGVQPRLMGGSAATDGGGFRSSNELVKAMSDPRYNNDPAYTADVHKKLERSGDLGMNF